MKAYHQAIYESGSSKSSKLLKVRNIGNNSKRCFFVERQRRRGHVVDGNWEAVVGLSEAASVSHDDHGDGSAIEEEL